MITYKKASLHNVPAMQKLVQPEVDGGIILPRSNDEIATNIRSYTLAFDGEELVGFCALHIHSSILAEIRSLIVKEEYRSRHIGSEMVNRCVDEAKNLGLKQVLTLTYKQSFFENLGFTEIPKESIPDHKIWADCIKCKHFPVCNEISLIKNI